MILNDFYIQKKIQGGDIVEFERLFVKYYGPLCNQANKIVKDMDAAEDIVQEFFYNFWKNRETFSTKVNLNAYLYHSIHNNALHYLKHLTIQQEYAQQVEMDFKDGMLGEMQQNLEMGELNKIIRSTLKQMPKRCSSIFCMNRFEGKKYREIAEILSISVKTVEADMGKALQFFRKSLKDYSGPKMNIRS